MEKMALPSNDKQAFRSSLVDFLRLGKVIMLPTDTVYGFSCRADDPSAIAKIFSLKGRDQDKPLLILVSSLSMAKHFCRINKIQEETLKKIWKQTRPTSVLLPHRGLLPDNLNAGSDHLAVRLPKSIFLRKIIKALGSPLVSTSANLSGQRILEAEEAALVFADRKELDVIVTGGLNHATASRLLLLDKRINPAVLPQGAT